MWEINSASQIIGFLYSLILGAGLCLVYDILRALRHCFEASAFAVFLCDVFFSVFSAFVTFAFLLAVTNGEVRAYILISLVLGFVACRFSISKLVFPMLYAFFILFRRLYAGFNRISERFWHLIMGFFSASWLKFEKIFKIAEKRAKKLLKSVYEMLYTNLNKNNIKHTEETE